MKAVQHVNIHNKFDIVVTDAKTKQVKQEVTAYNIVLNSMWSRLTNFSSYFTNIHFGTGEGTLDPTRTSLFNWLGQKGATNTEVIKELPVSSWRRQIVLNPEEYVGRSLTEVGIAYGTGSTTLVTHAILKDAEGHPISILKTDTDVVTIFATVYVTFGADNVELCGMPNSNPLVNYLVGGSSFPSCYFSVGPSDVPTFATSKGNGAADTFGNTSSVSTSNWIKDGKKVTTPAMRFGTNAGNGDILEVSFGAGVESPIFRAVMPIEGVFEGQQYTDVPVGLGDGVTKSFLLPSKNIKQDSISAKVQGVPTFIDLEEINRVYNFKYNDPASLPASYSRGVALTPDGKLMAVAHESSPYITTYDWVEGAWVKRPNPASLPTNDGKGVALTPDGTVMAVAHRSSPFITTYDWSDGAWVKRPNPASRPTDWGLGVALTPDGTVMAVASRDSPFIITYDWSDGAWVMRPNPASLPPSDANGVALTSDGKLMAVAHESSPYITTYDWVEGAWVKRPNPASRPTGDGYGVALTPDGNLMAVAHSGSPYITTYDWVEGVWVKRPNPASRPTDWGLGVALTPDGTVMAVASRDSPFIITYDWVEGAWVKRPNPASLPAGGSGVAITPDGSVLAVAHSSSPYITTYDCAPRQTLITFDTAPAQDAIITASYITKGIHKTDQYVIDMSCSIVFG